MNEQQNLSLTCEEVREKLFEFYHGELEKAEEDAMRAHIASCPGCQAELDSIEKTVLYIRSCVRVPEKSVADGVMKKINRPFYRNPAFVRYGSLAAAFVLIVGVIFAFGPSMKKASENMAADSAEMEFFGMEEASEETVAYDMASNGGFSYSAKDDVADAELKMAQNATGMGAKNEAETEAAPSETVMYSMAVTTSALAETAAPSATWVETASPTATMAPAATALPETTRAPAETQAAADTKVDNNHRFPEITAQPSGENPIRYCEQTDFGPANGWQNFGKNGEIRTITQPIGSTVVYDLYSYFIRNGIDSLYEEALPTDANALASFLTEKNENGKHPLWESLGTSPDSVSLTASSPLYGGFPLIHRAEYTLTEDGRETKWIVYLLSEEGSHSAFSIRVNSSYDTVRRLADAIAYSYRPLCGDGEADISGLWFDTNSQRCNLTLEKVGNAYNVTAHWSSSVSEATEWTMTVQYDAASASYRYENGVRKTVATNEEGEKTETVVYDNGSGEILVHNGYLYWNDDIDAVRDSCAFEKYEG